jgi:hypothetical protein
MSGPGRRATLLLAGFVIAAIASTPAAHAQGTFVDGASGDDGGDCTQESTPCETIAGGIDQAGPGNVISVAPGTYEESVTLGAAKSLVGNSNDPSQTIIDTTGSPSSPALRVLLGDPANLISGFTFRSAPTGFAPTVGLGASVVLRNSVFDADLDSNRALTLTGGLDAPVVEDNVFEDPDPTDAQTAIFIESTGSPEIRGNEISGFRQAIYAGAGTPRIIENDVSGTNDAPGFISAASAVMVTGADATLVGNRLHDPDPSHDADAINIYEFATPTGATLRRNRIEGHHYGIEVANTTLPVTLESDLVTGQDAYGITTADTLGGEGTGDVSITNATLWNPVSDFPNVLLQDTHLTMDSTISKDGVQILGGFDGSCEISHSRGPATTGSACEAFQTSANPQFADAAAGDFRLGPGSPMIDAGNPATPAPGALDLDGAARVQDGDGDAAATRDIGAFEAPDTFLPETTITKGPPKRTTKRRVGFRFRSEDGASFRCRFDSKPFKPCSSPHRKRLGYGRHVFRVFATDPVDNVESEPAKRRFRIVR